MLAPVILAAGRGSRMGSVPKALLKIENKTFLDIIATNISSALPGKIYLVLGHYKDEINASIDCSKFNILINPRPERGQLSSLHTAINNMPSNVTAIMVTLVDLPLIKDHTYKKIVSQWKENKDKIHVVTCRGRRGHPVIFPKLYFKELLSAPPDKGARTVLHSNINDIISIEVNDSGIRKDFDTRGDYQNLLNKNIETIC